MISYWLKVSAGRQGGFRHTRAGVELPSDVAQLFAKSMFTAQGVCGCFAWRAGVSSCHQIDNVNPPEAHVNIGIEFDLDLTTPDCWNATKSVAPTHFLSTILNPNIQEAQADFSDLCKSQV